MNKTLLALMISASVMSVPALAASLETNASGQAAGNAGLNVQETETVSDMAAQGSNQTRVEVDQQALGEARGNTENSVRQAANLGGSAAGEVRQSGDSLHDNTQAEGSADLSQTSGLVVETADGVVIDLNSETAADAAVNATAGVSNLVGEGQRLSGALTSSVRGTAGDIADNTRDTATSLQGALSVTSETTAELSASIATSAVEDVRATVEQTRETVQEAANVSADVQSTISGTLNGNINGGVL